MSHKMFGAQVGWTSTRAAGRAQPEIETSQRSPKPRLVRPQLVGKCCSGTPCYSWGYHELGSEVLRRDIPLQIFAWRCPLLRRLTFAVRYTDGGAQRRNSIVTLHRAVGHPSDRVTHPNDASGNDPGP